MKVFESTQPTCTKALETILAQQGVLELLAKAAEVTIEIEGDVGLMEGQAVCQYVQDVMSEDADLQFRIEPTETQGNNVQLVLLVKEQESLIRKAEKTLERRTSKHTGFGKTMKGILDALVIKDEEDSFT